MTIVILAAGASRRMGRQKLLLPVDGRSMIERAIDAASGWPIVIVAGADVADALAPTCHPIVRNASPERGMAHSLALGNAVVPDGEPIAVLLADLPDMSHAAIASVVEAYDDSIDVVVPRCGERFAHPVIFGPHARHRIAALPDGDTIKRLRDADGLRRRIVEIGPESLTDIDTPADYEARAGSPEARAESSR